MWEMIWQIISSISVVVTCLTFLLYLSGRMWVVLKNRHTLHEKFEVLPYDTQVDIEEEDHVLMVDDGGCEFALTSDYGISTLTVYKLHYNQDLSQIVSRERVAGFDGLNKDTLFIRCDLGEVVTTTQFEIRRTDYTKITFDVYQSGKNGHILTGNYRFKLTFKGFLYRLCV